MHNDQFIEYLLETLTEQSLRDDGAMTFVQVLSSELLTLILQNCGEAFRSKFVITL